MHIEIALFLVELPLLWLQIFLSCVQMSLWMIETLLSWVKNITTKQITSNLQM